MADMGSPYIRPPPLLLLWLLLGSRAMFNGISPDVGVKRGRGEVSAFREWEIESREPSRLMAFGAGGARYDFLLCCSIMLMAHSRRFTGVRLAAWRKASLSCVELSC